MCEHCRESKEDHIEALVQQPGREDLLLIRICRTCVFEPRR